MIKNTLHCLLTAFVLALSMPIFSNGNSENAEQEAKPEDFGWIVKLKIPEDKTAFKLTIPEEVYKKVYYSDLSDIRIFDADNKIIPHHVDSNGPRITSEENKFNIPLFPVYLKDNENKTSDLSVYVEKNKSGSIVQVRSATGNKNRENLSYYLLDISGINDLTSLELNWESNQTSTIHMIDLDGSYTLKQWDSINKKNPVFKMDYDGHQISESIIEISNTNNYKYLRIKPVDNSEDFLLREVTGIFRRQNTEEDRNFVSLEKKGLENGAFVYDAGGSFPIDSIRFVSIPENSGFEFMLYSRSENKGEWNFQKKDLVYNLNINGTILKHDQTDIYKQHGRYWKIEIIENKLSAPPEVEVGWIPQKLVFFKSGKEPYRLAFGNAGISTGQKTLSKMLSDAQNKNGITVKYGEAETGKIVYVEKGFDAVNVMSKGSKTRFILWIVIAGAVFLLLFMARSLYAQIQNERKNSAK